MSTRKIINLQTDPATGDGILLLEDLKDVVDITRVVSYSLEPLLDEEKRQVGIILKLFDKDGKLIN